MYDMAARSVRINARIAPAVAKKVQALQRRTRKSATEIVTEALELYCDAQLRRPGQALEALQAAGFVGCAEGPTDLSTTYKALLAGSLARKT
jgi:predicted transcriptional regulator